MLEKIIKKDTNVELENILEQKQIDEQAKNILQGILYKIEVSYKDYKKVKGKKETEQEYVQSLLNNIQQRCNKIKIVKPNKEIADDEIQKNLQEDKFFVKNDEITSYPIEVKLLYAIEKSSNFTKILNNKYEEATIAVSDLINTGKNLDKVEVLRDFNGWSWTTINKEVENIEANLVYQSLQILLGEKFLIDWTQDKDGIIDYFEQLVHELSEKYNNKLANEIKNILTQIAIINTIRENIEYRNYINDKIQDIDNKINDYDNSEQNIIEMTERKKVILKELNEIEKILGQKDKLQEEFEKINQEEVTEQNKKIFSIKVLRQQFNSRKRQLLEEMEKINYLLNPLNYLEEKRKLLEQKDKLKFAELQNIVSNDKYAETNQNSEELIKFIKKFLKCFNILIQKTKDEELLKLIYQFRYFMLLPFDLERKIKDIEEISKDVEETEQKIVQKTSKKKIINDVPLEIMKHVFETRIIILEELYYKITKKEEKFYVQLFDENVSEEKYEITPIEKMKVNKKIKIFI